MKVVSVVLLSILALANAGPTLQNIHFADSFQQSLSPQEYHVKLAAPDTELSVEDHVVEYFNSLDRQERSFIGDVIKNALDGFRDVVINGNDDVPVLDPFVIDHMGPFLFTATGVRGEANIRNFRVEGLRWFLVDHVTFNALRLTLGLQVTVPWITTTGSYDARASIAFLTHNAGGNFRVFVNRLVVGVDVRLGANIFGGGQLFLRELDIKIDIHDTHISIDGMFGSSLLNSLISSMVQRITQDVIQSQLETVSQTLSEELFDAINDFLKDFTLADISG